MSTGCAPRPIRGARGMGGERLAPPQRGGQSLRATPRPFAWRGGCGAGGARGRRRRGGGTFSAALRLSARPAPVPGNPRRTRAVRGGAAPAGASRCAGSGQSWGWRGFCRSILTGARDPEPEVPRYSQAAPTRYFACAPPNRERRLLTFSHCLSREGG